MFTYKVGRRYQIKFAMKVPQGEAGEMLEAIGKMADDKEACVFIPFTPKSKDELLNRYRARIANWRNSGRIPAEISLSITEDNQFAIYHKLKKRGRPPMDETKNGAGALHVR